MSPPIHAPNISSDNKPTMLIITTAKRKVFFEKSSTSLFIMSLFLSRRYIPAYTMSMSIKKSITNTKRIHNIGTVLILLGPKNTGSGSG